MNPRIALRWLTIVILEGVVGFLATRFISALIEISEVRDAGIILIWMTVIIAATYLMAQRDQGHRTPQAGRAIQEMIKRGPEPTPPSENVTLPAGLTLTADDVQTLKDFVESERTRAALWEFRYLSRYLVPNTVATLEWLASLGTRTTVALVDDRLMEVVENAEERRAILNVLQTHYLVIIQNNIVEVTPKGHEYLTWMKQGTTNAS